MGHLELMQASLFCPGLVGEDMESRDGSPVFQCVFWLLEIGGHDRLLSSLLLHTFVTIKESSGGY